MKAQFHDLRTLRIIIKFENEELVSRGNRYYDGMEWSGMGLCNKVT